MMRVEICIPYLDLFNTHSQSLETEAQCVSLSVQCPIQCIISELHCPMSCRMSHCSAALGHGRHY